jgi:secreted Zn-dependent insulinase-like peptidase
MDMQAHVHLLFLHKSVKHSHFPSHYVCCNLPCRWSLATPSTDLVLPVRNDFLPTDFSLRSSDATKGQMDAPSTNGGAAVVDAFPSPPSMLIDEPGLRLVEACRLHGNTITCLPPNPWARILMSVLLILFAGSYAICRLWHKLDSTFRLPRTNAYFRLYSTAAYSSPKAAAHTHLLIKLLEDSLCETAYLADVAGLHYNMVFEGRAGVDFKLDGFSQKLPLLACFIFRLLVGLLPDRDAFERVKEALIRQVRSFLVLRRTHTAVVERAPECSYMPFPHVFGCYL